MHFTKKHGAARSRLRFLRTSRARAGGFCAALLLLALADGAQANQLTVTITGTVASGEDYTGYFTAPGGNLNGQNYVLTYDINDADGVADGVYPTCDNGLVNSGTNTPDPLASFTVNGKTWYFGQYNPASVTSFILSNNASSPKTSISNRLLNSYSSTSPYDGSQDQSHTEIDLNSISNCRDYESAWSYTPVSGTDTFGGSVNVVMAVVNTPADFDHFSFGLNISGFNITGTSPLASLTTSAGQNWGCNSCDTNSQSANQSRATAVEIKPNVAQGDPINAAVGNMAFSATDFVGGPATHLYFMRSYNSQDTSNAGLGVGWKSNYHRALQLTSSTSITVVRQDGRQDIFTLSGGNWTPQTNVTSALAATGSGYQVTWPDDTKENYNVSGQLTSIVERNGLTTSLSYTSSNLTTVTGPFGHTLSMAYNALNLLTTMTLPDGTNKYVYAYDQYNNLVQVTNPDSTMRNYGYGSFPFMNLMTAVVDEDGNPYANWTYDSQGRALTSQHAAGVDLTTIAYTTSTSSTVTDANGNTHDYALTTNFGLVQPSAVTGVPDQQAGGASFTYDANGFVASRTDYDGNVTRYSHNAEGEEISRTEAYGTGLIRTTTTIWSGSFHLPTEIDAPLSVTTTLGYDANGNLTKKSITDGTNVRTWSYTYNANEERTSATDPLGNTTTWTYDGSGDVATEVNALGQTTTYNAYDGNGRLISFTNAVGLTTTYSYDKRGRVGVVNVGGLKTTTSYDSGSNKPSKVTYPDTSYQTFTYDDAHRLVEIKDVAGDQIEYTYDDASNLTQVQALSSTNTVMYTHSYTYDAQNRRISSTGLSLSETTTYSYDSQSNLLSIEDPNGHFLQYTYDDLNRRATFEDPYSGITTNNYDALDRIISITDPLNNTTTYSYNGLGDVLSIKSPDAGTTTNSYNAAGLLLTTTDARSKTASYTYDALNRTSTISYSGGTFASYLYDTGTYGTGHLTKMVDPAGTTTWAYDQYGQLLKKVQTTGSLSLTTSYLYDGDERVQWITYPSGKSIKYTYDASGRVNAIASAVSVSSVTYFPFGMATSWTEPNGSGYVRTLDQDGRITEIALNSTTTNTQTLTYDEASNLTALSETGTTGSQTFGYDSYNRLTTFFNNTATTYYGYDANSNRLSSTLSGTTTYNYTAGTNRLASLWNGTTTISYSYDASGDMTGDGTTTYNYDSRRRLTSIAAGTTTASYGINGFGQRITKSGSGVSGGTNEYVWDEQGNLLGIYGSTGSIVDETIYLPNTPTSVLADGFGIAGFGPNPTPVAVLTGTGTTVASVSADWQGNPHIITNSTKGYIWTWNRYAFGDNAPNQNPSGLGSYNYDWRFIGQIKDGETGLNYNYFRDTYDAAHAQYRQPDPIGMNGGQVSLYAYDGNNPMMDIDADGLGGPWHPPDGVRLRCTANDTCPQLQGKMFVLLKMINSHQGWDWNNPSPQGGGRHAQEISDLWRAYANCQALHENLCMQFCPVQSGNPMMSPASPSTPTFPRQESPEPDTPPLQFTPHSSSTPPTTVYTPPIYPWAFEP